MQKGFTIIELIIVVTVLGILSVYVVPKFADTDAFNLTFVVDDTVSSLRYAQKYSVAIGCDVQASITANTLTLLRRQSCTTGSFNQAVPEPGTQSSSFQKTNPSGVTFSSSSFPMYFDSLGRAYNSSGSVANMTLQVNSRTIQIIGETGFVYEP